MTVFMDLEEEEEVVVVALLLPQPHQSPSVMLHTICTWNRAARVSVSIWSTIIPPKCCQLNFNWVTIVGIKFLSGKFLQINNEDFFYSFQIIFSVMCVCVCLYSVQNGDFISVFVDCAWTNSFVVSRRLYSLPVRADVEIGRGFNVSIFQQLIISKPFQNSILCV